MNIPRLHLAAGLGALALVTIGCGEPLEEGESEFAQVAQAEIDGPGQNYPAATCPWGTTMVYNNHRYECRRLSSPYCDPDVWVDLGYGSNKEGCVEYDVDNGDMIGPSFENIDYCIGAITHPGCASGGPPGGYILVGWPFAVECNGRHIVRDGMDVCESFVSPICNNGGFVQYFDAHPRCVGGEGDGGPGSYR